MRVHIETGILVDYLAQGQYALLRTAHRNGRDPGQLYRDAREILQVIAGSPIEGAISALTFYEIEEALYKLISGSIKGIPNAAAVRLAACRPILVEAIAAARFFDLNVLELSRDAVDAVARSLLLMQRGVRAADALHVMTAANHGVDLILSADRDILKLDGLVINNSNAFMRCLDSDAGLTFVKARLPDPAGL